MRKPNWLRSAPYPAALLSAQADKPVTSTLTVPHKSHEHIQHITACCHKSCPPFPGSSRRKSHAIQQLAEIRQELVNETVRLSHEIEKYAPFGAFGDQHARPARAQAGVNVTLFRTPCHRLPQAPNEAIMEPRLHGFEVPLQGHDRKRPLPESCEKLDAPEADYRLSDAAPTSRRGACDQNLRHSEKSRCRHCRPQARSIAAPRMSTTFAAAADTMRPLVPSP